MSIITPEDLHSAVWKKLSQFVEERLDVLRRKNDGAYSMDETSRLRGQIFAYKELLALGSQATPVQEIDNDD